MEDALEKILNQIIAEQFSQEKLMLILIKEKLGEYGIELTTRQERELTLHLQKHGLEGFSFEPNRRQKALLTKLGSDDLLLDFQHSDLEALQNRLLDAIKYTGIETTEWLADKIFKEWRHQSKSILKKIRLERRKFTKYHNKKWGKSLDLLDALINLSLELGNEFSHNFGSTAPNNDIVFNTVKRLHARGCQVSSEILTLLREGFADGAHARWRTLHEINVIAQFIATHDAALAEKYLAHSAIVDYQRALQYRKHSEELSYVPLSEDEFGHIKTNYESVKEKYGKEFKNTEWFRNDYWWASAVLNNPHPSLANIEENIGITFMQPFVKLAHINVHAGSKGLFLRLGSPPMEDSILAGASVFGIGEPGQNTAYTISNLTTTLLLYKNKDLDNIASVLALRKFMEEVIWEFDRVMEEQEKSKEK